MFAASTSTIPTHPIPEVHQLKAEGLEHLGLEVLQRSRASRARAAGRAAEAVAREERAAGLRLDAGWLFLLAEVASC